MTPTKLPLPVPPLPPKKPLTVRQHQVLTTVTEYFRVNGEPCTATFVARRLRLDPKTVKQHMAALKNKGWTAEHSHAFAKAL